MAMFGVRVWLTPMHNTRSPVASLRLAWFSNADWHRSTLLPMSPLSQHYPAVCSVQLPPTPRVRSMANQTGPEAGFGWRFNS